MCFNNKETQHCSAFDADLMLFDRISRVDGDLIVCGIAMLDAKIKIQDVEIQKWCDQMLFYLGPDDLGY